MISIFQPSLSDAEAEAVRQVMFSNWPGRGKMADRFEADFADFIGVDKANLLSITSCTEGLFLSMDLLGIEKGDIVILPSISFIGAANAIVSAGGRPAFCDVDRRSLNATAETIEDCIRHLKYARKERLRAIILLHYGGVPCDMDDILALSIGRDIPVIEDSACSPASHYNGQACGTFGSIGLWSFGAMKILSTGDGGMIYTDNKDMRQRAEKLGFLGLTNASGMASSAAEWWEVDIDLPGHRFLMNDLNAAIGIEQLKKLPMFVSSRRTLHSYYRDYLYGCDGLIIPPVTPPRGNGLSSYYMFWIQLESEEIRNRLAAYLRQNDVYTTFRYYPLHWVKYYRDRFLQIDLPGAEWAARRTLCLPLHQSITRNDVEKVCGLVIDFMERRYE